MLTTFKSAVLSAAIALGAIAGAPAAAQAESGIYFHLGTDDGYDSDRDMGVQVQDGYTYRRHDRRYDRRYIEESRRCTPERSVGR